MVNELIENIKCIPQVKVVSFDIFDTLLFRAVLRPDDIFAKMYRLHPEMFPDFTNDEDWRNARRTAEQNAKSKAMVETGSREVYLSKIYDEIPMIYKNKEELLTLEIDIEKKFCYLNPEIYETIRFLQREMGKKIILISDMYLGEDIIREILTENGMEEGIIDSIFMSCDYGTSKGLGGLYEIVLKQLELKKDELFHIGDNYYGDVGVANRLGIHNYLYGLISEARYRHPYLYMEELIYGSICKEIYTLRLMAANQNEEMDEEKKFFFELGAMIVGPLVTYAIEWVLDEAEVLGIDIIRPLMREGKLLTELLETANAERDREVSIKPIYISRYVAFSGSFDCISENDIRYILRVLYLDVQSIFKMLNIEELSGKYKDFLNIQTEAFRDIPYGEGNLFSELYGFLCSPTVLDLIRKRNSDNPQKLYEYLVQEDIGKKCITLDIGWQGSIQNAMAHAMRKNGNISQQIHLLFFSKPSAITNAANGCDIRGFIGNFGKNEKNISRLSVKLFETFFLCTEGTTVGYERYGDYIHPVLREISNTPWQVDTMQLVQKGVKAFQRIYLDFVKKKPEIVKWTGYKEELCQILERLFSAPENKEVKFLKKINFEQNYGVDSLMPIMKEELIECYQKKGKRGFYSSFRSNEDEWYSGLNICVNPAYYYELHLCASGRYTKYSLFLMTQKALEVADGKRIVLVGAGRNTRQVIQYLAALDRLSLVEGIVDNNIDLQGASIAGIRIKAVEHKFDTCIYFCTIMQKAIRDSLFKQIRKVCGEQMKFLSYYERNEVL